MNLDKKTVLITGAARGIGKAIALKLAESGARIIIGYNSSAEKAEELSKQLKDSLTLKIDVSDNVLINKAFEELKRKNEKIDVLINNAGVLLWKPFKDYSLDDFDFETKINFLGPMKVTNKCMPLLNKGATIINISSVAAIHTPPQLVPYAATKAGVINFTIGLSKEVPEFKVYAISPGLTATDMTENKGVPPEKVATVVLQVLEEKIKLESGGHIDVRNHY